LPQIVYKRERIYRLKYAVADGCRFLDVITNVPQLPFLEVLAAPSNLLRNLVTKDPGFMLANLMRDSLQAWVTTGTNIIRLHENR